MAEPTAAPKSAESTTGKKIRLVASDLDGTLLAPDRTVNPWTRSVLDAVRARGVLVVPVTARQPVGLAAIAEQAGFLEDPTNAWAICVNGALGTNLVTGEVAFEHLLPGQDATAIAEALAVELPELRWAAVRERGQLFSAQHGYSELASYLDHHRDPATMGGVPLSEVFSAGNLKVVVRHPRLTPVELMARIQALGVGGFEATISGANFVELSAAGVTKGTGVADLCTALGIEPDEVVAFGDAHNDLAMLRWAGTSFAMQDSDSEVLAAAGGVAGSNADDGVARTLMELIRAGRL